MSKLIIAVDCDDVLVASARPVLDYYNRQHGTNILFENYLTPEYQQVWEAISSEEAAKQRTSYIDTPEYMQLMPVQETIAALHRLTRQCELHIVTGRPSYLQDVTLAWLERYLPDIFKMVVFTDYFKGTKGRSKADVCAQLGAHYLVDDHLHHCTAVADRGMQALLFGDYPWNRQENLPQNVQRVRGWADVERVVADAE